MQNEEKNRAMCCCVKKQTNIKYPSDFTKVYSSIHCKFIPLGNMSSYQKCTNLGFYGKGGPALLLVHGPPEPLLRH